MMTTDWSSYAEVYDLMCENNPAYRAMVHETCEMIGALDLPAEATILDLGAGTGNFSIDLARRFPDATVVHVDADPNMIEHARAKAAAADIGNVEYFLGDLTSSAWSHLSADLVLSVHALYACGAPGEVLERAFHTLKPGAFACFVDLGRHLNILDWSTYIFRSITKDRGYAAAVATFVRGIPVARANRQIARAQSDGRYWTHSPVDFRESVESAGFIVEHLDTCYRGYSDRAVCVKS